MSTPQQPQPNFQPNQYGPIPQQPAPYGPQPPQQLEKKAKRFGWLALGVAALVALLLGVAIGGAGGKSATVAAAPAPTVTVTAPAPTSDASSDEPSDNPTEDSSGGGYQPSKSDFDISVKTLSKECYGSAGCNVSFRIKPTYAGSQTLPTSGEIEVTYKITGLEDPVENTFTVDGDGNVQYDKEEFGQTESKGDKLGAKVTDVEYTP